MCREALLRTACLWLGDIGRAKGVRGDGALCRFNDRSVDAFAFQLFGVLGRGGSLLLAAPR